MKSELEIKSESKSETESVPFSIGVGVIFQTLKVLCLRSGLPCIFILLMTGCPGKQ